MSGVNDVPQPAVPIGRYRWVVVALLFAAMTINYVDRQMIGVLKPTLSKEMGWSETDYANIIFWFQASYAIAYIVFGNIVDRLGARLGFALAFVIWTIGHFAHAAARDLMGFILARVVLGVGEGGGFPGGIKAVAEWFPKKERAFATGIFNAGTNIGAIATPLIVPAVTLAWGWEMAFIVTGLFSLIWLPLWLILYRHPSKHPKVTQSELAYISSDPPDPGHRIGWFRLLRVRETWAYALGKFLIDPIWWMFLFWLPDFLAKRHGLDLKTFGIPLVAIYLLSDVGSVAGGWLSSRLMHRGYSLNRARKLAMLICALFALPVAFAANADTLWVAVLIIGLATAAHQGFSANLYTLPSDVFPRAAVGSVVGIGGMLGAIGGMAMAKYAGWVLDKVGTYTPIFIVASTAYLLALLVVHLLTPRMAPVEISEEPKH
ncbi:MULTISPECIES: MFS transporter [unclassified Azospirillum]|uniref:MFS transporter n=1 Tax=unclassified Azospirillum TaxID=2630922 RepID=UPI000B6E8553|nr:MULTISPECIES: MFS transporter [unclassified Azospirillum]SNS19810.1 MFS transporter, ACS family, hexuronate transporter [Azospirillum sp. RU38E]SNS37399.1 MFS transporter, ACS family, hexuronate transporter [Azospirillum sp. RU37A]